jgi:CheY-like chemotaxis protein
LHIAEDLPRWYIGDELRLSQVITNLLANAVKFTPDSGTIRVTVESLGKGSEMDRLRFSVSDTGIGMTVEQIDRLFSPFAQADKSITQRFGGTGLGLAISKSIIEKMQGHIWVESEPGAGSTFKFELFLKQDAGHAADSVSAAGVKQEVPDFSGLSLLFAEDIEINREIFMALMEDTRIRIDIAKNGLEAVEKFRANGGGYDLIIMDIQMPEMNGYEATRAIRALGTPKAAAIPIIAMTANAFREDVEQCLAAGMNDHLAKPVDDKRVWEKISNLVPGKRLPAGPGISTGTGR